jgi:DNA-directed RNA polymerase specialized sigma24 family protein
VSETLELDNHAEEKECERRLRLGIVDAPDTESVWVPPIAQVQPDASSGVARETSLQLRSRIDWGYHCFAGKAPKGSTAWCWLSELVFHVLHHQAYGHFPRCGSVFGFSSIKGMNHDNPDDNLGEQWLRAMGHADGKNSHLVLDVDDYKPERDGKWEPFSTHLLRIANNGNEARLAERSIEREHLEGQRFKKTGDEDGKPVEGDSFYQTASETPRTTNEEELEAALRSNDVWSDRTTPEDVERERILLGIGGLEGTDKEIVERRADGESHKEIGAALGKSESAISKAFSRIKKRLLAHLEKDLAARKRQDSEWTRSVDLEVAWKLERERANPSVWQQAAYKHGESAPLPESDGWGIQWATAKWNEGKSSLHREREVDAGVTHG